MVIYDIFYGCPNCKSLRNSGERRNFEMSQDLSAISERRKIAENSAFRNIKVEIKVDWQFYDFYKSRKQLTEKYLERSYRNIEKLCKSFIHQFDSDRRLQ